MRKTDPANGCGDDGDGQARPKRSRDAGRVQGHGRENQKRQQTRLQGKQNRAGKPARKSQLWKEELLNMEPKKIKQNLAPVSGAELLNFL